MPKRNKPDEGIVGVKAPQIHWESYAEKKCNKQVSAIYIKSPHLQTVNITDSMAGDHSPAISRPQHDFASDAAPPLLMLLNERPTSKAIKIRAMERPYCERMGHRRSETLSSEGG